MIKLTDDVIKRFWSYVIKTDSCWLWASCKPTDYGHINIDYKTYQTHCISYEIAFGEIPKGLVVCHTCDIPSCVNPAHLFVGTQQDNMQDMIAKGRRKQRTKNRRKYGSHFYIDKKTGYGFASVDLRLPNGRYKKFRRRASNEQEALIIAEQLKKEAQEYLKLLTNPH
jgi:HNH endonuclease